VRVGGAASSGLLSTPVTQSPLIGHVCPIDAAAGGPIDRSWCFDHYGERLAQLPPIRTEADALHPDLVLATEGRVTVRYCPFDYINPKAKVLIVGITPGLRQMYLSCREAQRALAEGLSGDDVLRRAANVGAFAGSMRTNLVSMLDGIGLPAALGIQSTSQLFTDHAELLQSTSALLYPVFIDGKNYGGSPEAMDFPILRSFVDQVLAVELAMLPDAFIIPLGRRVAALLRAAAATGAVTEERCLFDFPHPSGANGHRASQYESHRQTMTRQIKDWPHRP
jgi:hypothetical protein